MNVYISDYIPEKLYSKDEFYALEKLWRNKKIPADIGDCIIPVSLNTVVPGVPYHEEFKTSYLSMIPPNLWTYQNVVAFKNLIGDNRHDTFTLYTKNISDGYSKFRGEAKTKFGTNKDIFQSGHSVIWSYINTFKTETFRCFVFGDARNDALTLTLPFNFFNIFFNIILPPDYEGVIEIPPSLGVLIKRDPVIWIGSLQPVKYLRVNHDINNDCIGVSPFLFESLNMDVDGDTAIGYIIPNKFARQEIDKMMSPLLFGHKPRWKLETNHIIFLFCGLLTFHNFTLTSLSQAAKEQKLFRKTAPTQPSELPLHNLFNQILYHEKTPEYFKEFASGFIEARDTHNTFKDMMNYMLCFSCDSIKFQHFIIDKIEHDVVVGIEQSHTYECVYNNILFFTGILTDFQLFVDFVTTYQQLPSVDTSFFSILTEERADHIQKYKKRYIETSNQLPKESNMLSILHLNSDLTYFSNNAIYTGDVCILEDVAKVIPLNMVCKKIIH
jgi:hypothetical protein